MLIAGLDAEVRCRLRRGQGHPVAMSLLVAKGPQQGLRGQERTADAAPKQALGGVQLRQGGLGHVAPAPHGVIHDGLPVRARVHVSVLSGEWWRRDPGRPGRGPPS